MARNFVVFLDSFMPKDTGKEEQAVFHFVVGFRRYDVVGICQQLRV